MSQLVPPSQITTLVDLLRYRAGDQPHQLAYRFLVDGETETISLTYNELDIKARRIAVQLRSKYKLGDRILLLYPPGLDYIAAFFGCLYAGMIAVPAYPPRLNRSLSRLQGMISDCQAAAILSPQSLLIGLEKRIHEIPDFENVSWESHESCADFSASEWQDPAIASQDLAFLQYTSGSTATPKGVMISHGNLLHNLKSLQNCFEFTDHSIGFSWLPLYHDMGLIGGVLEPLFSGCPVTLMSPLLFIQRPFRWLDAISRYQVTVSGGPNFAYDLCVHKVTPKQKQTLDLSSWEVAFNGAEPIHQQTLTQFSEAFSHCGFEPTAFYPCYGMAENTLFISGGTKRQAPKYNTVQVGALANNQVIAVENPSQESQTIIGCGQSISDQTLIIVNPKTLQQCEDNEIGEIWISGLSVAQGYWNQPKATAESFSAYLSNTAIGPFLRSGDSGFLDDGELYFTGRLKDIIVIHGLNHYPQDIEWTIEQEQSPCLRSGCIAAFSINRLGEEQVVILAEVERRYLNQQKHSDTLESTIRQLRHKIWQHHQLQIHQFMLIRTGTLPKTSSGKIQRYQCRDYFLTGQIEPVKIV